MTDLDSLARIVTMAEWHDPRATSRWLVKDGASLRAIAASPGAPDGP